MTTGSQVGQTSFNHYACMTKLVSNHLKSTNVRLAEIQEGEMYDQYE